MTSKAPRVLLSHPGRQHSDRAAAALAAERWLAAYWTGIPVHGRWRSGGIPEIPESRITVVPWVAATRRGLEALLPDRIAGWGDHLSSRVFDRWAASRLGSMELDAVIGYEVGCRRLFREARRRGMKTILDAAAIHPAAQIGRSTRQRPSRLAVRVLACKESEIRDADAILVVSSFARETYVEAGVPEEKVFLVPLGVDLERFGPAPRPRSGPVTFAFVGSTIERKGIDALERAFQEVVRLHPDARLRVAGAVLGPGVSIRNRSAPGWEFAGKLHGEALVDFYRASDVLVLPSLEDSFGLVVPEALACGVPVIVTERTGARDLVREGENGWVVPAGDAARLTERLVRVANRIDEVRALRPRCVESVRDVGWNRYSEALIRALTVILGTGRATK